MALRRAGLRPRASPRSRKAALLDGGFQCLGGRDIRALTGRRRGCGIYGGDAFGFQWDNVLPWREVIQLNGLWSGWRLGFHRQLGLNRNRREVIL